MPQDGRRGRGLMRRGGDAESVDAVGRAGLSAGRQPWETLPIRPLRRSAALHI